MIGGEGEDLARLQSLAASSGVDNRVLFTGRLSEGALVDHLARCRAVIFVPKDEDYGFVTVEAFASAKAVITTTDSGGPAEFVRDGDNGFIVAPDATMLAMAFARTMDSATDAERMGRQALLDIAALTWPATVDRLLTA